MLLIFFMLTTTYALLQKMLDSPTLAAEDAAKGPPRVTREQVAERMLMMRVTMEKASPAMEKALPMIRIEGNAVAKEDLLIALQKARRSSGKVQIALEHEYDVPHGIILHGERGTTVGHQMNREILRLRADVNAVIHLHHDETIAFFAAGYDKLNITGLTFPYLMQSYPHYLPAHLNVEEDVGPIKSFIKGTNCIIMKRHGFTVLGRNL